MPLVNRTFDQLINFTRTTAGTFVGSNGLIQSTPQSRNLLTFTEEFDNAAYINSNVTVTANAIAAPDGTITADLLTAAAGASVNLQQSSVVAATSATYSIFAKQGSGETQGNTFRLRNTTTATTLLEITINYSTGAITYVTGSTGATAVAFGNGWWRITLTATTGITPGNTIRCDQCFVGPGTIGHNAYVWGAQLEVGSTATAYTRNFGGLFPPRFDFDPVSLAPRGLLVEEQRTNLLLVSEQFNDWLLTDVTVTPNTTVSPSGATNADSVIETTATSLHRVRQLITVANGTACAVSVFARATGSRRLYINAAAVAGAGALFDLTGNGAVVNVAGTAANRAASIQAVGNGWYRCVLIGTGTGAASAVAHQINRSTSTTASDDSYTGDGTSGLILWGAQLEAGAFATSYIPTVASQVTRTADIATIAAPNFASWYNASEGTFVVSASRLAIGTADAISATLFNDGNNIIELFVKNTDSRVIAVAGGATQVNLIDAGKVSAGVPYTSGAAYRLNDYALATNAGTVLTDTSATVPTVVNLGIGSRSGGLPFNGHIRSISYFPVRLSNAQLQALTA